MQDCIITHYKPNSSGYGSCRYMGRKVGAHVAAYCKANNLTPEDVKGKVVMHSCDNRLCVNPEHLSLGTQSQNIKDAVNKRRTPQMRGVQSRKLTHAAIEDIKQRLVKGSGGNVKQLASEFGVHWQYILQVARGMHDHRERY